MTDIGNVREILRSNWMEIGNFMIEILCEIESTRRWNFYGRICDYA